jgi:multimeric flavodoxin WrbA
MKVVGFNASARKDGNTAIMIRTVFGELQEHDIETELVQLAGKTIRGCTACGKCVENQNNKCIVDNDILNECIEKMHESDGIIIGSPTYFADVTAEGKALIDRAGYVARANDHMFKRKVGAAVVAVRRAGSIHVFDSINHFFLISQMVVPGSIYWNMGIGRVAGEVKDDEEGLETMRVLGRNMAWLLEKTHQRA